MHNRIKSLRKELKLTQEKFGEKLGMKKNSISQIENGVNALTEQLLVSICREFSVNENWLRTGDGKMFVEVPVEDEYFKAVAQISKSKDKLAMQAIIEYW
ncbi:helix-turn-helix domain-containing protein, partial [Turicimonas muris]|uniref:helix-turn-helix domain-containing protein n=1 Tax=Turicimonas muris TaxID=1796652 RepID=UPI00321FB94F